MKIKNILFPRRSVVVTLRGGLGNNLFQYFAGLYLAEKLEAPLVLFSPRRWHGDPEKSTIHGFKVKAKISAPKIDTSFHLVFLIVLNKIWQKVVNDQSGLLFRVFSKLRIHFSRSQGFDADLEKMTRAHRLEGYFGTHRYFTSPFISNSLKELVQLDSGSTPWFRKNFNLLRSQKALCLHIRRGDYVNHKDSNGLLAEEYYLGAISQLRALGATWDCIWIFTDDEEAVRKEFPGLLALEDCNFLEGASEGLPGEVLAIMSQSTCLVVGNSTFSWWAAMLGNPAKTIVAPTKWSVGMEDPDELIPDSWLRQESKWVD